MRVSEGVGESVREGEGVIEREGVRERQRNTEARLTRAFAGDPLKHSDICAAGAGNDARLIQTVARQV